MKTNSHHLNGLTGLRGFFALWVLGLHLVTGLLIDHVPINLIFPDWLIHFFDAGFWGVDGFFILSGFILSYSYSQKLSQKINLKEIFNYLWNRLARFFPVHLTILLIYALIQICGINLIQQNCIPTEPSPMSCKATVAEIAAGTSQCATEPVAAVKCERFSNKSFFKHLFLISSWSWNTELTWNFPAWSISSEWFMYLLFPVLILGISRIDSPKIAIILASLVLISMTLLLALRGFAPRGIDPEIGLIRVTGEFICGCLIYRFYCSPSFRKIFWLPVGLAAFILLLFFGQTLIRYFFSILLSLIILSVAENNNPISNFFSHPKMVWLGRISYSLYMSQLLTLEILGVVFGETQKNNAQLGMIDIIVMLIFLVFCTLVTGSIFYYFIEEPARLAMKKFLRKKNNIF